MSCEVVTFEIALLSGRFSSKARTSIERDEQPTNILEHVTSVAKDAEGHIRREASNFEAWRHSKKQRPDLGGFKKGLRGVSVEAHSGSSSLQFGSASGGLRSSNSDLWSVTQTFGL